MTPSRERMSEPRNRGHLKWSNNMKMRHRPKPGPLHRDSIGILFSSMELKGNPHFIGTVLPARSSSWATPLRILSRRDSDSQRCGPVHTTLGATNNTASAIPFSVRHRLPYPPTVCSVAILKSLVMMKQGFSLSVPRTITPSSSPTC